MKLSQREKILLLIIAYLLIIYIGFKYVYTPVNAQFTSLQSKNQQLQQQVKVSARAHQNESQKLAAADQDSDEYNLLKQELPGDPHLVEMVDLLGSLADKWRVQLETINYKGDTDNNSKQPVSTANVKTESQTIKGVSDITYNIVVSGRYYQLLTYLQQLEHTPRIISVDSVSVTAGAKKSGTNSRSAGAASSVNNQDSTDDVSPTGVNAANATVQSEREIDKYDTSNLKMNIQITTYYSSQYSSDKTNGSSANNSSPNSSDTGSNSVKNGANNDSSSQDNDVSKDNYSNQKNDKSIKQEGSLEMPARGGFSSYMLGFIEGIKQKLGEQSIALISDYMREHEYNLPLTLALPSLEVPRALSVQLRSLPRMFKPGLPQISLF